MLVSELFRNLRYNGLSAVSTDDATPTELAANIKNQVIISANKGLMDLYSRFIIRKGFITVEVKAGVEKYQLVPANAVSQGAGGFILDSVLNPFEDNVLQISQIHQEQTIRNELSYGTVEVNNSLGHLLQTETNFFSAQALNYNTLLIRGAPVGLRLVIEYQAKPVQLSYPAVETEEIFLPPTLEEALETYITCDVYGSRDGEKEMAKVRTLKVEYEEILFRAKQLNLAQESGINFNTRFANNGWI